MGNIDWMPIKSAPKDGTYVLLWGDGDGVANFSAGSYVDLAARSPEDEQGYWECDVHNPTHWAEINPPEGV